LDILNIDTLVKEYSSKGKVLTTRALAGISFKVSQGDFVAIMGPSGSGKTTLLNILSGIDKATSGLVEISGQVISKLSKDDLALFRRSHLGFVFQDFNLLDSLSIKENIILPMILDKVDFDEIKERLESLSELLDISEILDKYPYTISGGQQQRAAICRAIANNPDIIFADEPTGNLDSKSSKNVMKYFEKLNKANGSTILMVTHDSVAASFCNRVIFIKDGVTNIEIRKKGTRKEFFEEILSCLAVLGGDSDDL
jgi:putative ABC transport system ATP-binding protein